MSIQKPRGRIHFFSLTISLRHFLLRKLNVVPAGKKKKKFKGCRCISTELARRMNLELRDNKITGMTIIPKLPPPTLNFKSLKTFKCFMKCCILIKGND